MKHKPAATGSRSHEKVGRQSKTGDQKLVGKKLPPLAKPSQSDDDDDQVEEYKFDSQESDGLREDEIADSDDQSDVKSIISVSSGSPSDVEVQPSDRPWLQFNAEARCQWEMMYTNVTSIPMSGSWEVTEDYQRERDAEMLRYMEDFPLRDWVIPKAQADQAYFHLLERTRWRSLGIRIYGRESAPDWVPGSVNGNPQPPQGQNLHSIPQHYNAASQGSVPTQHQYHMSGPSNILPSQPHTQPISLENITSYKGPPVSARKQQKASSSKASHMPRHDPTKETLPSGAGTEIAGSAKVKKKPLFVPVPPSPPTPPYPIVKRPIGYSTSGKGRRKDARNAAEPELFPWNRQIDFREAKANATWDDSIYDPETLSQMAETRARNQSVIAELDVKVTTQQRESMRSSRAAKKRATEAAAIVAEVAAADQVDTTTTTKRRQGGRKKGEVKSIIDGGGSASSTDSYLCGQFAFATAQDKRSATKLGYDTPVALIDASEAGRVALSASAEIQICWRPGKRGLAEKLEQAAFGVGDTVRTRQQLARTPILTPRAAKRIIDFCPDRLWRGTLLRMASEAGYGNKDVRDRFCANGCYCDKATITKRISAALGQKQAPVRKKVKGYAPGELDWYEHNIAAFSNYIDFFGIRSGHRNWGKNASGAEKRKRDHAAAAADDDDDDDEEEGSAPPGNASDDRNEDPGSRQSAGSSGQDQQNAPDKAEQDEEVNEEDYEDDDDDYDDEDEEDDEGAASDDDPVAATEILEAVDVDAMDED